MGIRLEYLNFIVPIKKIEKIYPGGWTQCLRDHFELIGGRVWYDDHLFRDGAMDPMAMDFLLDHWKKLGFRTHKGRSNPVQWLDVCIVDAFSDEASLPCNWIEIGNSCAKLQNTEDIIIVGPENFRVDDGIVWKKVFEYA
ncbi:MAG: hypothetical protein J7L25_06420 [Deltaproteobacteria bacterium]|nr:hypothetical protein [Candidatus Tharpella aukensis]